MPPPSQLPCRKTQPLRLLPKEHRPRKKWKENFEKGADRHVGRRQGCGPKSLGYWQHEIKQRQCSRHPCQCSGVDAASAQSRTPIEQTAQVHKRARKADILNLFFVKRAATTEGSTRASSEKKSGKRTERVGRKFGHAPKKAAVLISEEKRTCPSHSQNSRVVEATTAAKDTTPSRTHRVRVAVRLKWTTVCFIVACLLEAVAGFLLNHRRAEYLAGVGSGPAGVQPPNATSTGQIKQCKKQVFQ